MNRFLNLKDNMKKMKMMERTAISERERKNRNEEAFELFLRLYNEDSSVVDNRVPGSKRQAE